MLTKQSLVEAINIAGSISALIESHPDSFFEEYMPKINPILTEYEAKNNKTPNVLFKNELVQIDTKSLFDSQGFTFRGRKTLRKWVWATLKIKPNGDYLNDPQLFISANEKCIHFGLGHGDNVKEDNYFVNKIRTDKNIQNEILRILKLNTCIKLFNTKEGDITPPPGSEILINTTNDVAINWHPNSHLQGVIPYADLTETSGETIRTALKELYNLYQMICLNVNVPTDGIFENQNNTSVNSVAENSSSNLVKSAANLIGTPRNKIIYGAPGTGKSHELRNQAEKLGFHEDKDNIIRITFYPGYSYQQFIGTYKPKPVYREIDDKTYGLFETKAGKKLTAPDNKEPLIDYSFVPGPFINLLVKAINNKDKNYMLIIEEINRANVATVFGDVFQLLDRDKNNNSEYYIEFNPDVKKYLDNKISYNGKVKIPSNMFIWATMNNADQGVMPLDSAFKRRWAFEYITIDKFEGGCVYDKNKNNPWLIKFGDKCYEWNKLRKRINEKLKSEINEDKLLGPFFMNEIELQDPESVKNKLLLYLREDVLRHKSDLLFKNGLKTFSDISASYDNDAKSVFADFENNVSFWNTIPDENCTSEIGNLTESENEENNDDEEDENNEGNFETRLNKASADLRNFYENIDNEISNFGNEVKVTSNILKNYKHYAAKDIFANIRLRTSLNTVEIHLKTKNPLDDPHQLLSDFTPGKNVYKKWMILRLNLTDFKNHKFTIEDILNLVKQSYNDNK